MISTTKMAKGSVIIRKQSNIYEEAMYWNITERTLINMTGTGGGSIEFEDNPYFTSNVTLFDVSLRDVEIILDGLGNHTVVGVTGIDSVFT
ncbi:MAG: hypothetical protein E4H26_01445, partial [Flavobacteriales bacterium]